MEIKESISNCIKVLLRCKKLYEAKAEIIKIIKMLVKRDKMNEG